jgi:chromosomal replication initiator protein
MEKKVVEVWEDCLKIIKDNINYQSFKTWFLPIKPIKLKDNILTIQVPSQFFFEWLEEHYIGLLKKTIRKELGSDGRLEYSIIMDNSEGDNEPYTIKVPTTEKKATVNNAVAMPIDLNRGTSKEIPNPFIIPGLRKIKVNSQLKIIPLQILSKVTATVLPGLPDLPLPTIPGKRHLTHFCFIATPDWGRLIYRMPLAWR